MKYDTIGLPFKTKEEQEISSFLLKSVLSIRRDLSILYNVNRGVNENYKGLCDISVGMLKKKIEKYSKENNINIECHGIHGEQAHCSRTYSKYWCIQHTWAVVIFNDSKIYVDPTSSQFKDIYEYIPDYYISNKKPKWYYDDKDNPRWNNKYFRWLNDNIRIQKTLTAHNGSKYKVSEGIIEYIQYDIYGKLCDILK